MTIADAPRSRSGRAARRAERAAPQQLHAPYIVRGIPTYDILGEESLLRIEAAADRILAEIGIDFRDDPGALDHWRRAGARIDGLRVRFEPGMLREILKTAPAEFTQHARNPANSVRIGGRNVVFAPAYGSPFVMDLDRGRRFGTLQDFENFVKLAQASPWLHHSGGTICEPTDIAVNKRHLDMVYAHVKYSDRAFLGSVTAEERAEDSIDMARIVFGRDFTDAHCVIMGNFNVNSPLVWDGTMTRGLRAYARANQGVVIVPFILGGAMGPVTNAGAIAQSLAETMAGCALAQLERPGAPVIFGNFLSSTALRSGSPTFGTPEPAIGSMVVGQLARRLNLPLRCSGNFSNAKLPDAQAMMEGTMSMLAAVQCGANYVLHAAGFLDGLLSMSYEKFVLDCDLCGVDARLSQGCAGGRRATGARRLRGGRAGQPFLRRGPYPAALRDRLLGQRTVRQRALREMAGGGRDGCRDARQRAVEAPARQLSGAAAGRGPGRGAAGLRGAEKTGGCRSMVLRLS